MMMSSRLEAFRSVWVIDTEFRCQSGERNEPVCLCALEIRTGRRLELFFDRHHENPFDYSDALFVCYGAAAEWKTFLSLGWELPHDVLDLHFEYLTQINGVWQGNVLLRKIRSGLPDAIAASRLYFPSHLAKEVDREFILPPLSS